MTPEPVPEFIIQSVGIKDRKSGRVLRPGELARLANVSVDTLRHYERKGLLSPRRRANRYREYPAEAADRVRLVRRALSVGFGLDELARILKERDRGGAPCQQVRRLAAAKLHEIERLVEELCAVRDDLRRAVADWDIRLQRAESGQPAHLLEALAATEEQARLLVDGCKTGLQVADGKLQVKGPGQSALRAARFRAAQRRRRKK